MPAAMIVSGPAGTGGPAVRRTVQRVAVEKPLTGFRVKKLRGQVLVTPDRANPKPSGSDTRKEVRAVLMPRAPFYPASTVRTVPDAEPFRYVASLIASSAVS